MEFVLIHLKQFKTKEGKTIAIYKIMDKNGNITENFIRSNEEFDFIADNLMQNVECEFVYNRNTNSYLPQIKF